MSSVRSSPVSQYAEQVGQQDGVPSPAPERSVAARRPVDRCVLNGRNCRPLIAYSSLRVDLRVHVVDHRVGAAVPVGDRLGQQPAIVVEQAVVDRPGVDADGLHAAGNARASFGKPDEDLLVNSPVRSQRRCPSRFAGPVGESGAPIVQLDAGARRPARHHPAARCADVDRAEHAWFAPGRSGDAILFTHRRKAAATPESTGMCSPVVRDSSPPVSANTASATWSGSTSRLSRVRWA